MEHLLSELSEACKLKDAMQKALTTRQLPQIKNTHNRHVDADAVE